MGSGKWHGARSVERRAKSVEREAESVDIASRSFLRPPKLSVGGSGGWARSFFRFPSLEGTGVGSGKWHGARSTEHGAQSTGAHGPEGAGIASRGFSALKRIIE